MAISIKRIAPGEYEVRLDDTRAGIVERSRRMPWCWWWSAWSSEVDVSGMESSFARAKRLVVAALRTGSDPKAGA